MGEIRVAGINMMLRLAFGLMLTAVAWAQGEATISGSVTDPSGALVAEPQ